jgi:transposase-like protein
MTKPAGRILKPSAGRMARYARIAERLTRRIRPGERLRCNACNGKFRVTHGTPFEGTHLPLQNWFTALYLMAAASKGIS